MTWGVINNLVSVDTALKRNMPVWDLVLTDWGDSVNASDGTNLIFPAANLPALPAPAAISIGPRSTVDRASAIWDALVRTIGGAGFATPGFDDRQQFSLGSPLLFTVPANRYPTGSRAVVISALPDTQYVLTYTKADGTSATFGSGNGNTRWVAPTLHLRYYLVPPEAGPPTQRVPLELSTVSEAAVGAETLLYQVPIYGRKKIYYFVKGVVTAPGATNFANIRVGFIRQIVNGMEETVAYHAGVPVGGVNPTPVYGTLDGYADYMNIYATPDTSDDDFQVIVTAYD